MINMIPGVFLKNKTWMAFLGTALVCGASQIPYGTPELKETVIYVIAGIWGITVGAQGVADVGKEKAKVIATKLEAAKPPVVKPQKK